MKCQVTITVEVELKDKYKSVKRIETSDRGESWEEVLTTPTNKDVLDYLAQALNPAIAFGYTDIDKYTPCVVTKFTVGDIALMPD